MKALRITSAIIFITVFYNVSNALVYETIAAGAWNDPTIWSTDGGFTSCGCTPPIPTAGDDVYIRHDVNMTQHLQVNNGSYLEVTTTGKLLPNGPTYYNLSTWGNAHIELNGLCNFQGVFNASALTTVGSILNINYIVTTTGRFETYGGTTTVFGLLHMFFGNFSNHPSGTVIFANGGKLFVNAGNIDNEGYLEICATCCAETQGNWRNQATGIVAGSGSAQTLTGNMRNFGLWSPTIAWCSLGSDSGMPSPEDCATANIICGAVVLPIELASFEVHNTGFDNQIEWTTVSEKDCDYFNVMRSLDGANWEEIDRVSGHGTTQEEHNYSSFDRVDGLSASVIYYRLEQVDTDGNKTYSDVRSVHIEGELENIEVYPNPAQVGTSLMVTNVETNTDVQITSLSGQIVQSINSGNQNHVMFDTNQLGSGYYIVVANSSEGIKTKKFAIQ